jgi:hypothetical protein
MRRADRDAFASRGAAAAEDGGAGFGLHTRPEAVRFGTVAAVRLEGSFGHGHPLLFSKENLLVSNPISISQAKFGIHPGSFHDVAREWSDSSYAEKSTALKKRKALCERGLSVTPVTKD